MFRFERSTDYALIRSVVTSPEVWAGASDDFSGSPNNWQPLQSEHVWYLMAWDDDTLLGLFALHPQNRVCWEVHTCLLKHCWGPQAAACAKAAIAWVWQNNHELQRIVTQVPCGNRLAHRFAKEAGMIQYGLNLKAFMKNGRLQDIALLGVSRPECAQEEA